MSDTEDTGTEPVIVSHTEVKSNFSFKATDTHVKALVEKKNCQAGGRFCFLCAYESHEIAPNEPMMRAGVFGDLDMDNHASQMAWIDTQVVSLKNWVQRALDTGYHIDTITKKVSRLFTTKFKFFICHVNDTRQYENNLRRYLDEKIHNDTLEKDTGLDRSKRQRTEKHIDPPTSTDSEREYESESDATDELNAVELYNDDDLIVDNPEEHMEHYYNTMAGECKPQFTIKNPDWPEDSIRAHLCAHFKKEMTPLEQQEIQLSHMNDQIYTEMQTSGTISEKLINMYCKVGTLLQNNARTQMNVNMQRVALTKHRQVMYGDIGSQHSTGSNKRALTDNKKPYSPRARTNPFGVRKNNTTQSKIEEIE